MPRRVAASCGGIGIGNAKYVVAEIRSKSWGISFVPTADRCGLARRWILKGVARGAGDGPSVADSENVCAAASWAAVAVN